MKFEFTFASPGVPSPPRPDSDTPFNILVLADLGGNERPGRRRPLAERRPPLVDVDNLAAVLQGQGAQLTVPGAAAPLPFGHLDDFHPDRLFERMDIFAAMRRARRQLFDPATFPAAAAEVRSWARIEPASAQGPAPEPVPPGAPSTGHESNADTLVRLLGRAPSSSTAAAGAAAELIRKIVSPHVAPGPAADLSALVAAVDGALADSMRRVLHDPAFQALEAAWRGIDFLLRNLETGEALKVRLLNVSRAELAADLLASPDVRQSGLFRVLVEATLQTPGAEPWALLLGLFQFEPGQEDMELLGRLAQLAQAAGAPFVAAASPAFRESALADPANPSSPGAEWEALRRRPEAAYIGLACPRFLLRRPYGPSSDPIAAFEFKEIAGPPTTESFLWGHPAIAAGVLLGQMFAESGWDLSPGAGHELGGLPVCLWKESGESRMTPCGEIWLKDAQAEKLLEQGLMPFQSIQGRDAIRLTRSQSIHHPLAPLAGRWA